MSNKLPQRLNGIPIWLRQNGESATETEIGDDVIAICFWESVDTRAQKTALVECQKLEDWIPTLPPEKQTEELHEQYLDEVGKQIKKWVRLAKRDEHAYYRLLAEGADRAFDVLMGLEDKISNVILGILHTVKEKGLLSYIDGEHSNLREYIYSKLPDWDENSEGKKPSLYYDMDFILDYVLPVLEYNGVPKSILIDSVANVHKARFAVPYLRKVLSEQVEKTQEINQAKELAKNQGATDEELALFDEALAEQVKLDTRLKDMLESLMIEMSLTKKQGGLTVRAFQEHMEYLMTGKKKKTPVKQTGYVYNTPDGGILMVSCENVAVLNSIKNLVAKLVDWHLATPEMISEEAIYRMMASYQPDEVKKKILEILNVNT